MSSSSQQAENSSTPPLYWDIVVLVGVLIYAALCAFGVGTDVISYRIWGVVTLAAGAVTAAGMVLTAARLRSYLFAFFVATSGFLSAIVGIFYRAQSGCAGVAAECGANMETAVVERAGRLLIRTGSPYLDISQIAQPHTWHYNPYSPLLSIFGIPRALFGDVWWTDARWFFMAATLLVLWATWIMAGRPLIPHGTWLVLAAVAPVSMNFVAAGIDVLIVVLMVLCIASVSKGHPFVGGLVAAAAVGMKLTALPVVVVALVFAFCAQGARRSSGPIFGAATVLGSAAVYIPAFVVNPEAFKENVFRYPLGLSEVRSSAQGATPGQLISSIGPAGRSVVLGFLAVAIFLILVWMVWRPPRTASRALWICAVGLFVAMLLMPASRFGYLVYPGVLAAAALIALSSRRLAAANPAPSAGYSSSAAANRG